MTEDRHLQRRLGTFLVLISAFCWSSAGLFTRFIPLDLWTLLEAQLAACGIAPAAQDIARRCSICDRRFFSFRRDGAATGHAGLIAGIDATRHTDVPVTLARSAARRLTRRSPAVARQVPASSSAGATFVPHLIIRS